MKHSLRFIFLSFFLFSVFLSNAQKRNASDIVGNWVTEENKSIVKIFEKDDKYYGKIIWLKEPNDDSGNPKTDKENPNDKLKTRKVIDMIIMYDFVFDGEKWDDGKVYDPKSGNTYSGTLKMRKDNIIDLRGYVGISIIGRTSSWIKYEKKEN